MDKKYREEHPEESFDGGYHLYAKEQHKKRVGKNADRIAFAIKQLETNNIEYVLKNEVTGHFHCRRDKDDALVQFWAGTGKILNSDLRGIHNLIRICKSSK